MKTFEHACGGCGKIHRVDAKCAGASITCRCGFQTLLPSLSELRWAGTAIFDVPTAETITDMVARGVLPESPFCVECRAKCEVRPLVAVCEQTQVIRHSSGGSLDLIIIIFGIPISLPLGGGSPGVGSEELHGRDVFVPVPTHICDHCWSEMLGHRLLAFLRMLVVAFAGATGLLLLLWFVVPGRHFEIPFGYVLLSFAATFVSWIATCWHMLRSAHKMRSSLKKTRLYAALLEEYPEAKIVAGSLGKPSGKSTAETITEMVARGRLPESPFCVECRATCDAVPLIAVCGPARWESHSTDFASHGDALSAVVGGFLFFAAPFLPSGPISELEVGRVAMVHVPTHICSYCWNLTLGYGTDTFLRVLVFVFGVATGLLLLLWFAAPWLVFDLPFVYVMMAGAAAFAFWVVRRWNLARLAVRLRSFVKKTPLYATLLEEHPEAKIVRGQSDEHA
jgi:hypothetical protein